MAAAKPNLCFVYKSSEIKINGLFIQLRGMLIVTLCILCVVRDNVLRTSFPCCQAWTHSLLFKSKETFKLAEIQNLEASMQIQFSEYLSDDIQPNPVLRFNLTRLVVDRATGSSLFRLDLQSKGKTEETFSNVISDGNSRVSPQTENFLRSHVLSLSCLQRCDWAGQVIMEGKNCGDLIKKVRQQDFLIAPNHYGFDIEDWNLDYVKLVGDVESKKKPMHTMKSLLCSVAREMPSRPSLAPALAKSHFLIVDSATKDMDSCFLIQCIDNLPKIKNKSSLQRKWAQRPFQYSSAINFEIAEMVLEILMTLCNKRSPFDDDCRGTKGILLDPTCGSGTFLALGIANGFRVEGFDINPTATEGAIRNLEYLFDEEKLNHHAAIETRDSCNPWRKKNLVSSSENSDISCVVANLPWVRQNCFFLHTQGYYRNKMKCITSLKSGNVFSFSHLSIHLQTNR